MINRIISLVVLLGMLNACSVISHHAEKLDGYGGMSVIHTPSDVQTSYVKSKESHVRFCTETDVDFSKTKSSGIALGIADESIGDQSAQGALALGGRDPAVLMTRELMFRACEFMLNTNADPRLSLKVYAGTLDAIIKISRYQQLSGTATTVANEHVDIPAVQANNDESKNKATTDSTRRSRRSSGNNSTKATDDSFNWDYDWDYADNDESIDENHP